MYGAATINHYDTPVITEKQINFVTRLCDERDVTPPTNLEHFSRREASTEIERLLATPRAKVAQTADAIPPSGDGDVEAGMYVLGGVIYKVQVAVHGSGKPYAKQLHSDEFGRSTFDYAPGVVRKLRPEHKLTQDQAREWGALYGTCCRCGRTLTAEDSIERMMGPVCYGKMGW